MKTDEGKAGLGEILWAFLVLSVTAFGGPTAHIGFFHAAFVRRRGWIDEQAFTDLVALNQSLPGATSSKVGIMIGATQRGVAGGLMAWIGFTTPPAIVLALLGVGFATFGADIDPAALIGLKTVAVAVVAIAVWSLAGRIKSDPTRATIAVFAAVLALAGPALLGGAGALAQISAIVLGGVAGWILLRNPDTKDPPSADIPVSRTTGVACLALFAVLLAGLPLAARLGDDAALALFDSFYRSGALVFGSGHVVISLLQPEVVGQGWIGRDAFVAGYGATQAMPGPLFNFSAYLGSGMSFGPGGWLGALICLLGMFLPSLLLAFGALPFWAASRGRPGVRAVLDGIGAAVVGLLGAALYDPIWTSAVSGGTELAMVVLAFCALMFWRWPPWLVVVLSAASGWGLSLL